MSLYGIPTLQRKSKPKKVMSEYARGGKVGLKCKFNSNGQIFCNKRNPDQRPNTSWIDILKGKTKQQMIDELTTKNIKNREELENMTAGEIRKLYEKPMDTPALRDAYKRESQKKKKAEAQKALERTGKVALDVRKKRAEKFNKKAQENKKAEAQKSLERTGKASLYETKNTEIKQKASQITGFDEWIKKRKKEGKVKGIQGTLKERFKKLKEHVKSQKKKKEEAKAPTPKAPTPKASTPKASTSLKLPNHLRELYVKHTISSMDGVYMWFKPKGKLNIQKSGMIWTDEKMDKLREELEEVSRKRGNDAKAFNLKSGMVKIHFDDVLAKDMKNIDNIFESPKARTPKVPTRVRKRQFSNRRNKKEMEETERMMMEDKDTNKISVKKSVKKPMKNKQKTGFNNAKEFLWMKYVLDNEADDYYSQYISENLRSKKERELWYENASLEEFSNKRANQLINGLKKFVEAEVKKEYDKLTGKSDKEIRKILMMKFIGEEIDDDELKDIAMDYY